ncbi:DMT family transporter [Azospirillum cavernae]|uniref:DMT family transporter n=1 Tax=Azospirillum cavernae TaxID=2320860 RepID=A0A418W4V7_9PROT|nr:DMT family transporter [Azospirillum cavernae]RJF85036.1 DMT family transporter [Azospirillum cavernae]
MTTPAPLLKAALWAVGSAAAFAASSAAAKFLGQKLPTAELAFFRAAFGVLLLIGVWRFVSDLGKARDPRGYAIRCGLGVIALYSLMYAFTAIPLALASLIFFTRVLLLPITARLMLGERSGTAVWIAVVIGFVGAALPLWSALALPEQRWGVIAALVASVASAGSQTAVRRLTATNSAELIVLIYTAVSVAATLPVAVPVWVSPPVADWPVLVVLGLCAVVAQLTAARAFALAPVGFLAPFDFLTVPAGAALGYLLFSEVPSGLVLAGSVITLAAAAVVTSGAWRASSA